MPATSSTLRAHAWAYTGLAALFLLAAAAFGQRAYDTFDVMRHDREYVRPPFYLGDANWGAVNLQPEAEAQGMKFGDAVLDGERPPGRRIHRLLRHPARGESGRSPAPSSAGARSGKPHQRRLDRPAAVSRRLRPACRRFEFRQ